ncbi:hypothetical protein ABZ816_15430 [Actinosynnema sp. NPDC047251]|uniref:hypothetical protein n=1 Tax=Saccharothrix espanaensis TaxID=103731 RepID=UPI0002DB8753|nr:hypothetical protein [Saccharothrix espanaensis]
MRRSTGFLLATLTAAAVAFSLSGTATAQQDCAGGCIQDPPVVTVLDECPGGCAQTPPTTPPNP